jgi:hypothetical protein
VVKHGGTARLACSARALGGRGLQFLTGPVPSALNIAYQSNGRAQPANLIPAHSGLSRVRLEAKGLTGPGAAGPALSDVTYRGGLD